MFKVKFAPDKVQDGYEYSVYGIRQGKEGTEFLLFDCGVWVWGLAVGYVPVESGNRSVRGW